MSLAAWPVAGSAHWHTDADPPSATAKDVLIGYMRPFSIVNPLGIAFVFHA